MTFFDHSWWCQVLETHCQRATRQRLHILQAPVSISGDDILRPASISDIRCQERGGCYADCALDESTEKCYGRILVNTGIQL